jgi:hypothetical protein
VLGESSFPGVLAGSEVGNGSVTNIKLLLVALMRTAFAFIAALHESSEKKRAIWCCYWSRRYSPSLGSYPALVRCFSRGVVCAPESCRRRGNGCRCRRTSRRGIEGIEERRLVCRYSSQRNEGRDCFHIKKEKVTTTLPFPTGISPRSAAHSDHETIS